MKFSAPKQCLFILLLLALVLGALCACETAERPADELPQVPAPHMERLATAKGATDFSVSHAFSSNMVLQREEPIRIWGWAGESRNGETVTGEFMGTTAEGVIADGEWLITLTTDRESGGFAASAASGNSLRIRCGGDEAVFENVLVGDVYMVIGQSNVAYGMSAHCINHGLAITSFVDSKAPIRLYYNTLNDTAGYPARGTEEVCPDVVNGRGWWKPTAQNIGSFTALGYLFARDLVEKTGGEIPIGIIEIDGNGQPIGSFMPNDAAGATDSDAYNAASGIFVPPGVNGTHARYMYNHYMYPYEKYALAGVVWYQGESDFQTDPANAYVEKFTALMEHMRSTHNLGKKDFPVYIVEIPTIYQRPADYTGDWHFLDLGYIRAEMGSIPSFLPNAYMATSSDIFTDDRYYNNLHPDIKAEQAARLADLAGSVWYGLRSLDEVTGPILASYEISEDRKSAILTFDNVGEGLATADGGTAVRGFAVYNKVGDINASATVTAEITSKNTVTVTSSSNLYGVLYNTVHDNFYGKTVNLCNSAGCPASAFTYSEARHNQIRREIVGEGAQALELTEDQVIAVHIRTTAEAVAIGTQLTVPGGKGLGGTVTLDLYAFDTDYATSVAGKALYSTSMKNIDNCAWAEVEAKRNRTIAEGEYLLVISGASNICIQTAGGHEGQVVYRDGEAVSDTSLLLGVRYASVPEAMYAVPHDPNNRPPETVPETNAPETVPESDTQCEAETTPDTPAATESEPADTRSETPVETLPADDGGCASTVSIGLLVLLAAGAGLALRRREE